MNNFLKRMLSAIILLPLSIFFIIKGSIFLIFYLILFFIATCFEWLRLTKKNNFLKIIGIIYLLFSFFSAYLLRENQGYYFFIFILVICIFTDIGGYVFGKILRGPKLIKLSPNKTYSGLIGSFLLSLSAGIIFLEYTESEFQGNIPIKVFFGIFLVSLISQIGDLIISYFKRKAKLKDTGKILPGHGGLLDRIDGLIFVIPIIYLFTLVIK
tara:strand:+ start:1862 stop:2497 length:636 start_codon:yes stop_codon:yes gene_type:complete